MRDLLLLVDDDPSVLQSLYRCLKSDHNDIITATSGKQALDLLALERVKLCLLDYRMPGEDGLKLLEGIRRRHPGLQTILMVGKQDVEATAQAMRLGAVDVLAKPFDRSRLQLAMQRVLQCKRASRSPAGQEPAESIAIIGESRSMLELHRSIEQVGPSSATILIQGESGTGKELIARSIQELSRRREKPFIRVNCAAIPDSLMESELFGHEKGAFTGAIKSKKGRFELADGGTIFLDEIGDMSPSTQMKVLRVLQEGEYDRVGATHTRRVDVRVIAATNVDLEKAVAEGRFRKDLYYRLRVIRLHVPPLRDRRSDIPALAQYFLQRFAEKNEKRLAGFSTKSMSVLMEYSWPGNVRELENAVERAVVLASGAKVEFEDLPPEINDRRPLRDVTFAVGTSLAEIERRMIAETLRWTQGDKTKAARFLGITARTIYRKLERRRLELEEPTGELSNPDLEESALPAEDIEAHRDL